MKEISLEKSEQDEVRHVSERYIAKSDPYIVMVSTPNNPGGLFYKIERNLKILVLYKRIKTRLHLWLRQNLYKRRDRQCKTITGIWTRI